MSCYGCRQCLVLPRSSARCWGQKSGKISAAARDERQRFSFVPPLSGDDDADGRRTRSLRRSDRCRRGRSKSKRGGASPKLSPGAGHLPECDHNKALRPSHAVRLTHDHHLVLPSVFVGALIGRPTPPKLGRGRPPPSSSASRRGEHRGQCMRFARPTSSIGPLIPTPTGPARQQGWSQGGKTTQ